MHSLMPQKIAQPSQKNNKFAKAGLDLQEKPLGPANPQVFRFSLQLKYCSEKNEVLVATKTSVVPLTTHWSHCQALYSFKGQEI